MALNSEVSAATPLGAVRLRKGENR